MIKRWFGKTNEETPLDKQIARIMSDMDTSDTDSQEYKELMKRLERLYKLKTQSRPKQVSRDTMLIVAGNLAGILVVVLVERKDIWTSRAHEIVRRVDRPT